MGVWAGTLGTWILVPALVLSHRVPLAKSLPPPGLTHWPVQRVCGVHEAQKGPSSRDTWFPCSSEAQMEGQTVILWRGSSRHVLPR